MDVGSVRAELIRAVSPRCGHFRLESGHHGDTWLALDHLLTRPRPARRFAAVLAGLLAHHNVGAVCGPLTGGAFVAQLVAGELDTAFAYSMPSAAAPAPATAPPIGPTPVMDAPATDPRLPVRYLVPGALRGALRGKRVAVVDDAVNAGSAVRGTIADLRACGAETVVVGTLIALGSAEVDPRAVEDLPVVPIVTIPTRLWHPPRCPPCVAGQPLEAPSP
ncbi:MAG: hypothetical protein AVDCRST_MAG49-2959 [uncultured Thermomicrobiales bacterium]|uniref:Phosphoribosyltransferase domain-containing protein n=1 Tax=uncultured Thermomicrobiales bacterium TaxID=1645740 RepID=A0A6J4URZ3_9BACT|nr:MAG: hypothetical protein AVDCRST_MAG49-2959 [uncultured Thermomicrobiales bacterium]